MCLFQSRRNQSIVEIGIFGTSAMRYFSIYCIVVSMEVLSDFEDAVLLFLSLDHTILLTAFWLIDVGLTW